MIDVLTRDFGGELVRAMFAKCTPADWYVPVPTDPTSWAKEARQIAEEFSGGDWLSVLAPALCATGPAQERLARSSIGAGVVVTTGQQPGLFGGPIYTWSKALTALAIADAIESRTGIPAAPVFWAATDDADYTEASYTVVAQGGEAHVLRLPEQSAGLPMAETPLGDVTEQYRILAQAAGSAIDPTPLQAAQASYTPTQTVGSAYVDLLRRLMQPLGIAVLDAAHPTVRMAAVPVVRRALQHASIVNEVLLERSRAIEEAGYRVQVQPVPNLSLVFSSASGARKRIPVKEALRLGENGDGALFSPNVLLRPIVERSILPTVTYVAGPAELAYFAQVSAVATALDVSKPRVVPRWSGMILEPHVQEILHELGASVDDFQDPHAIEGRVAREELAPAVRNAIAGLRDAVRTHTAALRDEPTMLSSLRRSVGGFEVQMEHRIARLERRFAASVKRSGTARLHNVAVARASLYPNGVPQERALNIIPFLARYGAVVRERMFEAATRHAQSIVSGA
jgi:bacillithiol biosynthesis cysteine-adding enzyme BshC